MSKNGTLYGVSLGPGDPGLITRRAWALLERPDAIWTYPVRNLHKDSYALDIAQRAGLPLPAQHLPLLFPMTHDAEKLARHWLKAAETVRDLLATGQDVLFLVEGDASTYASFSYLARVLRELDAGAQVQIVAGVSSFNAVCATVQVPLSEQDDTIAIVPAAYGIHAVEKMLDDFDTLVLMKVKPLLDDLIAQDCVLENSTPAPNGSRHVGRDACLAVWQGIIASPGTRFDLEDVVVSGDRATILWRFRWGDDDASSVRGVNLMQVRDGRIVAGMGYVKGA